MHRDRQKGINKALETQTSISKEWASQFFTKQYFKSKFKLSEKKLRTIVKTNGAVDFSPSGIIPVLEHKLDSVVHRLGWSKSLKHARHLVKEGKIGLQKDSFYKTIHNHSIRVNVGDTIVLQNNDASIVNSKNFIVKKKNNKIYATLIQPLETKIGLNPKKFELYCNRWGKI